VLIDDRLLYGTAGSCVELHPTDSMLNLNLRDPTAAGARIIVTL